jgi:aldehyde dehydrogenase (NAD+)
MYNPSSANHGQTCCAGSRIFVHSKIYDKFLERFTKKTKELKIGDPFAPKTYQCPQVSMAQFEVSHPFVLSGVPKVSMADGVKAHYGLHSTCQDARCDRASRW